MTGPEMSRRIAELLGIPIDTMERFKSECHAGRGKDWPFPWIAEGDGLMVFGLKGSCRDWAPHSDSNQIDAAVRECEQRWGRPFRIAWVQAMTYQIPEVGTDMTDSHWEFSTATPEQKCRALLAAYDELKGETDDLRQYAERLAKAMPERWVFASANDGHWYLPTLNPDYPGTWFYAELDADCSVQAQWAFFGPLLDELEIAAVWRAPSHTSTLEAVAEAVCRKVEAKAKGEGK